MLTTLSDLFVKQPQSSRRTQNIEFIVDKLMTRELHNVMDSDWSITAVKTDLIINKSDLIQEGDS